MKRDMILVVDDAELSRELLEQVFYRRYQVLMADNGNDALEKMKTNENNIAAVLLDIMMPGMDGFSVLEEMKNRGFLDTMPVILISVSETGDIIQKGLEMGAADFIIKPFQNEILVQRVKNTIELFHYRTCKDDVRTLQRENMRYLMMFDMSSDIIFDYNVEEDTLYLSDKFAKTFEAGDSIEKAKNSIWKMKLMDENTVELLKQNLHDMSPENPEFDMELRLRKRSGRMVWYHLYVKSLWEHANRRKYSAVIGKIVDIDQLKVESAHWKDQAGRDALTRVNNRMAAQEMIYASIHEYPGELSAFIFLDVDNFKNVNDNFGHRTGDEVLMYISRQLQKVFRKSDIIWRIGGDEFAVFARNLPDQETIEKKLDELCSIYNNAHENRELSCEISGSIGVAFYPKDGQDYDTLMSKADKALYYAKASGKNRYCFYDKTKM